MIGLAPVGAAAGLAWLALTPRPSRTAWTLAALALVALVFAAVDRAPLAATMAIEAAVVFVLARRLGLAAGRAALASGFVNAVTQPLFLALLPRLPGAGGPDWAAPFALGEAAVILIEAALYLAVLPDLRRRPARALALSLAANTASALIGLALAI
jgi:hypothetical protein